MHDLTQVNKVSYVPRDHSETFLLYLFNDPDFIKPLEEIKDSLKSLMGVDAYGILMLLAATKGLCEQLQEFKEYDSLEIIKNMNALAKRFDVSLRAIELGVRYTKLLPSNTFRSLPIASVEGDNVMLRLNANTRLKDIKSIYWYVEELQRSLPNNKQRNRLKDRPDLIYAIYKQRLINTPWKEIYSLYEHGRLPGYGGASSFNSEENLSRMYRRYKPDI